MEAMNKAKLLGKQPNYVLVAQSLINDITSGRYPVNSLLPTEHDMCKQFGMSRHTIREALRKLKDMGLVSRQQGVGTVVKSSKTFASYVQSMAKIDDLLQYVKETALKVLNHKIIEADEELCCLLKCKLGENWLKVEAIRYYRDKKLPIASTYIYIPIKYSGVMDLIGTSQKPIYSLIEEQYGEQILEVQQDISAISISNKLANSLQVDSGSPGLSIVRRYLGSDDKILEVAVNIHPADRFVYSMAIRREWSTAGDEP